MKLLLTLMMILMSMSTFAQTYNYRCVALEDNEDSMMISINEKNLIIYSPKWAEHEGKIIYNNTGLVGGKGSMKDRVEYSLDYDKSEVFPYEGMSRLLVQKELLKGGAPLKNDAVGGFITYLGHGYSYESDICFIIKR